MLHAQCLPPLMSLKQTVHGSILCGQVSRGAGTGNRTDLWSLPRLTTSHASRPGPASNPTWDILQHAPPQSTDIRLHPCSISITSGQVRNAASQLHPDLSELESAFQQISRRFICTLKIRNPVLHSHNTAITLRKTNSNSLI